MIDPRKAALIIIDMQHGFLDADSALCVAGAAATVPTCARALSHARELGMPVIHAVRAYAADGSDVEACRHELWLTGGRPVSRACDEGRSLAEPEALKPQPGDRVVVKPRFSAFFGTGLDVMLRRLGVSTVVLIGTTTPNCIRTTCYDALSRSSRTAPRRARRPCRRQTSRTWRTSARRCSRATRSAGAAWKACATW